MVRARRVARVDWSPVEPESDLMIRQESPTTHWRKPVAWTSLVLGVGSLAGAGTLTWFATDSADKYRNSMTHEDAYLRDRDTYTYSAIGMYTGWCGLRWAVYLLLRHNGSGHRWSSD